MLPRVLRRVFEHVAAAEQQGTRYQVSKSVCPMGSHDYDATIRHVTPEHT